MAKEKRPGTFWLWIFFNIYARLSLIEYATGANNEKNAWYIVDIIPLDNGHTEKRPDKTDENGRVVQI